MADKDPNDNAEDTEATEGATPADSSSPKPISMIATLNLKGKRQASVFGSSGEDIWGQREEKKKRTVSNKPVPLGLRRLMGEATAHYMSHEYTEAKQKCEEVIKKNPNVPDAFHILGLIHIELGEKKRALQFLSLAASLESPAQDLRLWLEVGKLAEELGDIDAALEAYETASKRSNRTIEAYERRSILYASIGNFKRAGEGFKYILDNFENYLLTHALALVRCYLELGVQSTKILDVIQGPCSNLMVSAGSNRRTEEEGTDEFQSLQDDELEAVEEKEQFEAGLSLFSTYISLLLKTKNYLKANGCITRFRMFMQTGKHGGHMHWKHLSSYANKALPFDIVIKFAATCILLGKLDIAQATIEQLEGKKDKIPAESLRECYLLLGEAYAQEEHWQEAASMFNNVVSTTGVYARGLSYDMVDNKAGAIQEYEHLLTQKTPLETSSLLQPSRKIDETKLAQRLYHLYCECSNTEGATKMLTKYALQRKRVATKARNTTTKKVPDLLQAERTRGRTGADFRPGTVSLINECDACFESKDYENTISIGLYLLLSYYTNGDLVSSDYKALVDDYPHRSGLQTTHLQSNEVVPVAEKVCYSLLELGKWQAAYNLASELYGGSACGYNALERTNPHLPRCYCLVICLALLGGDIDDIATKLVKTAHLVKERDCLGSLWTLFGIFSREVSENKNLFRIVKRLAQSDDVRSESCALWLAIANYNMDVEGGVRAIEAYFKALALAPENPFIHLSIGLCYSRLTSIRKNTRPNQSIIKSQAFLQKYQELRMNAASPPERANVLVETKYNIGVVLEIAGLQLYAEQFYREALAVEGVENSEKREIAFALSRIYTAAGNMQLAEKIMRKYLSV